MKKQADRHRSERQFQVGLRASVPSGLQPYIQSSLATCSNQKLAFKFFGPFRIMAKVGVWSFLLVQRCIRYFMFHSLNKRWVLTNWFLHLYLHPRQCGVFLKRFCGVVTVVKGASSVLQGLIDQMVQFACVKWLLNWEDLEFLQQQL